MNQLAEFVAVRLMGGDLDPRVRDVYARIAGIAERIRGAGKRDDWLSWLTGADPVLKAGEYLLGADAESGAAEFADQLLATLAVTWQDHPDFQAAWCRKVPKR